MDLELSGRTFVVTGASRGIGRAVVERLLSEGAKVVAGARHVADLTGVERCAAVEVDLGDAAGPQRLIETALSTYGKIDGLVNNVGQGTLHTSFGEVSDADWQASFDLNLMSAVRTTRAALPSLVERGGSVVMVSSLNGKAPAVEAPEYSVMKAAMLMLTKVLAQELSGQGVRVNAVTPGPVDTDFQFGAGGVADQLGMTAVDYRHAVANAVPLGRMATVAEIADVIAFLLSPRAAYIVGADIAVDGLAHG